MKSFFFFFKTTVLGGILVIVPLVIVLMVVSEAVEMLVSIVQPIAERLPGDWVTSEREARFLALFILLVLCFLTGLMTRTRLGTSAGHWIERTVLHRIPGYRLA